MLALFGTAALLAGLAVWSLTDLGAGHSPYLIAAAVFYLVDVVGLTIGYHVPHNDALEAVKATDPGAADEWNDYVTNWTLWNHVRTIAPLISMGLLLVALAED